MYEYGTQEPGNPQGSSVGMVISPILLHSLLLWCRGLWHSVHTILRKLASYGGEQLHVFLIRVTVLKHKKQLWR
ncbi:hypothetical protein APHNYW_1641 [Anaplasma phagocytophilum str. ApNYW]|nr:hypothetical protein APHNYW_1641 [Anaplasma phagocytophilum str. ApNYW]